MLDKKGGIADIFLVVIIVFILIVCVIMVTFAQSKFYEKIKEQAPNLQNSFDNSTNVSQLIDDTVGKTSQAYSTLPWITALLIIFYFLSILLSAFLVKTHPVTFVAYWLMVIVAVIISVYVSNVYETLSETAVLTSTWMTFSGANYIFTYLPIWVTIIGLIAGVLMFINLDWSSYYG
jgi:ABC-type lipoprotein release transport system permease subunit